MRAPRTNTIGYQLGSKCTSLLATVVLIQLILVLCDVRKSKGLPQNTSLEITACYDNSSTFAEMVKNKPRVVDVIPGSMVHLWCHFCEGKGDYFAKLWFYKPRGFKFPKEIFKGIDINDSIIKLSMTPLHILSINNFTVSNSGIYVCTRPEEKYHNTTLPFIYILEGIIYTHVKLLTGTLNQWQNYKRAYLDPINMRFKFSEDKPLKLLRQNYNLTFKILTIWDNWGECTEIDHQGIRRKIGRCRLRASLLNNTRKILPKHSIAARNALSYLTDGFDIPCRSFRLNETVPEISNLVRDIPDYQAEEACYVFKNTAKHKTNFIKEKYKFKSMKQVAENSHVTLSCTEVIPNSDLKWFKEEKLLNSLFRKKTCKNEEEPHISVDTNNSLHILHISKKEEGNYSCLLNGKTVQEFEVKVLSKAKLLNQEFIRYSIYLGFVLSLTMTCYFAGVCVAWHRKSSFADPLNLHKKENYGHNRSQCEQEKLLG